MTIPARRRRWIAATAVALLAAAAAAVAVALRPASTELPARDSIERPKLLLLTSLPIVFPEEFTLDGDPSPALEVLQSRYSVLPISTTDRRSLGGHRLLLVAQPHAQPAEMLVQLDQWVRSGGRALVLADPALEWPSDRPLGDLSRPPPGFPDTGLLGHWSLRLRAPDVRGPKSIDLNGPEIRTVSPGQLVATGSNCTVGPDGLIARCTIGSGKATIIADADFLGVEHVEGATDSANLALLLRELERLKQ